MKKIKQAIKNIIVVTVPNLTVMYLTYKYDPYKNFDPRKVPGRP